MKEYLWLALTIVLIFVIIWAVFVGVVDFVFAKALEAFLNFAKGG